MINNSNIISRTKDWWKPKAGNILGLLYIAAIQFNIDIHDFFYLLLPSILTIIGIGVTAYILNDWVDLPSDRMMNKKNMLISLSNIQIISFLILAIIISFIPWIFLPVSDFTLFLLSIEFLCIIFYALPPIRFKTKGFIGVLTDALYAYAIPSILAYYTFYLFKENQKFQFDLNYLFLFIWQLFAGIYNMSIHQFEDFENDVKTSTKTWGISIGKTKLKNYMLLLFWPLMIVFFLCFLYTLENEKWPFFIIGSILILFKIGYVFLQKHPKKIIKTPFSEDFQRINLHFHLFLPLIALILLIKIESDYCLLLLFHLFVFSFNHILTFVYISKKLIIIYGIQPLHYYLFNKIFFKKSLINSGSEKESLAKQIPDFDIALMNRNKNKYTETFVKNKLETLKSAGYRVHYLYGNELPNESEKHGTLLSNYPTVRFAKKWYYAFMNKPQKELDEKALRKYLLNNNIRLVLAEFGTVGSEIYSVCSSLKIPYIITFYGYDYHHESTLRSNKNKYLEAIENAEGIIGVSKEISNGIESLIKDSKIVHYLPCLVDTRLFLDLPRNPIAFQFLSIGRFAETKAPNLTILAFSEVLKSIPTAKLIMVGKDGGGELFESCMILAKALNIETSIEFKGICNPNEIAILMQQSSVFVQHSLTTPLNHDKEGTPVAVMEAMCAGLPIVATRHAGILDIIEHEQTGLLVDEYDWLAMAHSMIRLAQNKEFSQQIGNNAKKSIQDNSLIINGQQHFLDYISQIHNKIQDSEN